MIVTSKGGGRPGMMPEGTWRAKISRFIQKEGSTTMGVVFLGQESEAKNTECLDWINLDTAEWRLRLIYEAATGNKYPADGTSWDTAELENREVLIECEHRDNPNSGQKDARAAKIYPVG